jgi:hypothetical protein
MEKFLTIIFVLLIAQMSFAQTKIEEYGALISDDEYSPLQRASQEFLKNKDSKIYVLINKEKKMPLGRFLRYFYGVEFWFIRYEVPKESIIMVAGEEKEKQSTQIWLVKNNENPPIFKEVSIEEKLAEKITGKTLFDTNCIDCDESPHIKLGWGVYLAKVLQANPHSNALFSIQLPNNYSKDEKYRERKELTKGILDGLRENQIPRNRISIRFSTGSDSVLKLYIVPKTKK